MGILPAIGILLTLAPVVQRERLKVPVALPRPLFESLIAIQTQPKSEFETAAVHERRRQTQLDARLRGDRQYIIAETTSVYHAEARRLTLITGYNPPTDADSMSYPATVVVALSLEDRGPYVEQNVFGAQATSTRVYLTLYKLACLNTKESLAGLYEGGAGAIKVEVPLAPELAKRLTPKLRLLLEIEVARPSKFQIGEPAIQEPSAEYPYLTTTFGHELTCTLRKAIVYDISTGDVYHVQRTNTPQR